MTWRHFVSSLYGTCSLTVKALMLMLIIIPCRAGYPQEMASYHWPEVSDDSGSADNSTVVPVLANPFSEPKSNIAPILATYPMVKPIQKPGMNWKGLFNQSMTFLAIEQGYRLGTQPGTREALKGPFFDDWFESVKSTHGWGDGDDFLTNYIGHPMEGGVVGNIYVQNDPNGRNQTFSWNSRYWNSRLKAMAYTALYSTQFELGPISEASIGNVGHHDLSESGAVDLVVTPLAGLGWQVGEDALDKYLVMKIETWTENRVCQILARGFLNPTRSMANMIRLNVPWNRDTRPGIWNRGRKGR
jgi:hypothetical protein